MDSKRFQAGFSLIELMISITIGLLLSTGIINVYLESKKSFHHDQALARVQESGRFALRMISREIAMAGYLGGVEESAVLDPILIGTDCGVGNWATDITSTIEVVNDAGASVSGNYPCFDTSDFVTDTDVLIVKRTSDDQVIEDGAWQGGLTSLVSSRIYLQTMNGGVGDSNYRTGADITADLGAIIGENTGVDVWEYYTKIFHIAKDSEGIPNLCFFRLDKSGNMAERECLLAGVENIQIELGIPSDTEGDITPDQFQAVSLYPPLPDEDPPNVVAARVYLLVRNTTTIPSRDIRKITYQLGSKSVTVTDNVYRRVFSTTVKIRNSLFY